MNAAPLRLLEVYQFKLGDFACRCVSGGHHTYSVQSMFANAPSEEVQKALRQLGQPADTITTPYTHLLVDTGEHFIPFPGLGRVVRLGEGWQWQPKPHGHR